MANRHVIHKLTWLCASLFLCGIICAEPKLSLNQESQNQYDRGLALFENLHDEASLKAGFALFQSAAENGHKDALNALGLAELFGLGTAMNSQAGAEKLRAAANMNSAKALDNIALLVILKINFKGTLEDALSYYELAAKQGDAESQYQLGRALLDPSTRYDPDRALIWFGKASKQGNETAAAFVAGLNAKMLVKSAKQKEGLIQLLRLSGENNVAAKYWLGEYYADWKSGHADPALALNYYLQADHLGLHSATFDKIKVLENGFAQGVFRKEQVADAITFLETKQATNCMANFQLGVFYSLKNNPYRDYGKSRSIFEHGAKMGCELSILGLGDLYATGRGVTNDVAKALDYYKSVRNNSEAKFEAAALSFDVLYNELDATQHQTVYQLAVESAKMGYVPAFGLVSQILSKGELGEKEEAIKAYAWAIVAAERDPKFSTATLRDTQKKLTPEQQVTGVAVSQLYKTTILKRALQEGETALRF